MPAQLPDHSFKKKLKNLICLFILLCTCYSGFSQQNKPVYNLLWRISGNGVKKPSYLFGTMHVKDKRAFRFSDSVMLAIRNTTAFTMEVHPDTMVQQMFATLADKDSTRSLHKLLSKTEYEQLSQRFKERNGYEMGDTDPMFVESMMTDIKRSAGDKPTFVDAYLYGIARTMGKSVFGLEKAADQFNSLYGTTKDDIRGHLLSLLDLDDNEQAEKKESMIDVYNKGNIDGIVKFLGEDALEDDELVARNKVMARGIIAQLAVQPGFTAVGVAHLPGDNGLIALLRKAGYTLIAVPATFTGVADTYHIDYNKMPWQTYSQPALGYSIETPGKPVTTSAVKGLKTTVYTDLATGATFGVYAVVSGTSVTPAKLNTVVNAMIENYKKNQLDEIVSRKAIVVNGLPCTDVVLRNKAGYTRMNIYVQNNVLYCLYIGTELQHITQPYATRFFNSFKSFKLPEHPAQPWLTVKNDSAAFTVQFPVPPQELVKETPNTLEKGGEPMKLHLVYATDTVNLMNYIVRYNDYPSATYLADRKLYLENVEKDLGDKGKLVSAGKTVWNNGIEGREFTALLMQKYLTTVQVFPRGNRVYTLMRQSLVNGATKQMDDPFFGSFKLTPFITPPSYNFQPEGQHFTIQLPVKPRIINSDARETSYIANAVNAFATNPYSGGVYDLEYSQIGPYYRAVSIDSMYTVMVKRLVSYKDTLLKTDTVMISGHKGLEYITQKKGTTEKRRSRLLIDNGVIYLLTGHMGNEELFSKNADNFFTSLTITPGAPSFDLYSSKAEKIKEALFSSDTAEYKRALGALNYYHFNKDELPTIYSALKHNYADDTSAYGARAKMVNTFDKVNDEHTLANLKQLFNDAEGKDEVKAAALSTIPLIDTKQGYDEYLRLLTGTKPIRSGSQYKLFSPLQDSLAYAAANFSKLLPLVDAPEYRYNVLSLASSLVDEDKYRGLVSANFKKLTTYAEDDLLKYLHADSATVDDARSILYQYLDLMTAIKGQPITDGFTARILRSGEWLPYRAAITRINNRLPIGQTVLNKLLDSLSTRYGIMEAFNKQKQLAKVPLKYTTPAEFGRLCVSRYLEDEEDEGLPDKISLLGTVTYKGQVYYAYKFTMAEREEGANFIAIASPCKAGTTALNFKGYNAYTAFDKLNRNWQQQVKLMIPKFIEENKIAD